MPYVILLCGPQGSGKSTLRNNALSHLLCASTDDIIQGIANATDKSYTEVFSEFYPKAEEMYLSEIATYQRCNEPFVIDRTHINESSRKRTLRLIKPSYKKFAVYTPAQGIGSLMANIANRAKSGGHYVDEKYVQEKLDQYRTPTYNEGFDMIFSSSGFERVLQFMDFKDER